jgi:hypothetical protein
MKDIAHKNKEINSIIKPRRTCQKFLEMKVIEKVDQLFLIKIFFSNLCGCRNLSHSREFGIDTEEELAPLNVAQRQSGDDR